MNNNNNRYRRREVTGRGHGGGGGVTSRRKRRKKLGNIILLLYVRTGRILTHARSAVFPRPIRCRASLRLVTDTRVHRILLYTYAVVGDGKKKMEINTT